MAVNARRPAAPIDPATFAINGVAPQRVATPTTTGALARAVRDAAAAGQHVVFAGGGTLSEIGRTPDGYDLAIALTRLNRVIDYEPRDLTIAVEAGMTIDALARRLARNNQFVPFDAPLPARSTIGGVLAAGWHGPRSLQYGRPRDFMLGATVVLADGSISSSGGRTVKNVSGYDVAKLFVGSLGTLGAFARVNLKTLPRPAIERTAVCRLPERTRERVFDALRTLDYEPSAALHVWGFNDEIDGRDGIDGRLFLLFEGARDGIEAATREMRSALGAAGVPETLLSDDGASAQYQRTLDATVASLSARSATFRISGLPSTVTDRLAIGHAAAAHVDLRSESIADLLGGRITLRVSSESATSFAAGLRPFADRLTDACDGVSLLSAPPELRCELGSSSSRPASFERMRELKRAFDPKGTLAPGRLFEGI